MPSYATSGNTGTSAQWTAWVTDTASTAATTIWVEWTSSTGSSATTNRIQAVSRQETVAEHADRERRDREWREQDAQRKAAEAAAEERAKQLLTAHLTEDQVRSLNEQSAIVVRAESGRQYRLRKGWAGNVDGLADDGKVECRYCIHPNAHVPEYDNLLAQKLMLETNEAEFLRIANRR